MRQVSQLRYTSVKWTNLRQGQEKCGCGCALAVSTLSMLRQRRAGTRRGRGPTSSSRSAERVKGLGADEVIDYASEDVGSRVLELTSGRGVDAVLDTRGSESATTNLGLLVHGGGLAAIAGRPDLSAVEPFTTAPSVHEIALGAAHSHGDSQAREDLAVMLDDLLDRVSTGDLDPMVDQVVPLEQVPDALADIMAGHSHGKTVATLG